MGSHQLPSRALVMVEGSARVASALSMSPKMVISVTRTWHRRATPGLGGRVAGVAPTRRSDAGSLTVCGCRPTQEGPCWLLGQRDRDGLGADRIEGDGDAVLLGCLGIGADDRVADLEADLGLVADLEGDADVVATGAGADGGVDDGL